MKREVASGWSRTLVVCAKCSKKVGRAFGEGGGETLAGALRAELGVRKGCKAAAGVVEAKCLGLCPKGAVVVLDAARPGRWLLVRPGTAVAELVGTQDPPTSVRAELVEASFFSLEGKGSPSTSSGRAETGGDHPA